MDKIQIRILQLSDLHFGSSHEEGIDVKEGGEFLKDSVKHSPTDYLLSGIATLDPLPDLIFLSGDFVTGRDTNKDYSQTIKIISKLANDKNKYINNDNTDIEFKNRILVVPGNHDVNRDASDPLHNFRETFSDFLTPYTSPDYDCVIRKHAFFAQKRVFIVIVLI